MWFLNKLIVPKTHHDSPNTEVHGWSLPEIESTLKGKRKNNRKRKHKDELKQKHANKI